MIDPKEQAVKLALRKLFKDTSFSICTVDKLLKLTNTIPSKEIYSIMSTVHCVDYTEMSPEFRKWLFDNTIQMFCQNGFDLSSFEVIDAELIKEESKKSFFKNLLT